MYYKGAGQSEGLCQTSKDLGALSSIYLQKCPNSHCSTPGQWDPIYDSQNHLLDHTFLKKMPFLGYFLGFFRILGQFFGHCDTDMCPFRYLFAL